MESIILWSSKTSFVEGSYEFLVDLRRLTASYRQIVRVYYLLDAVLVGTAAYAALLLIGIPAFFRFYWQGSLFLAEIPAMISLLFGFSFAYAWKRRSKSSLFERLGVSLSIKAKTAYDNRDSDSVIMQSLAKDVKQSLSCVGVFDLISGQRIFLKDRSVPVLYFKLGMVILFLGCVAFFGQSQAGDDVSPASFESLMELKDQATGLFAEEEQEESFSGSGISGEIYGKPSLAVLQEEKLELEIFPGSGAGFRSEETEPLDRLFEAAAPGGGVAVPTELYIESLPPQHREIIKRYFENLANG